MGGGGVWLAAKDENEGRRAVDAALMHVLADPGAVDAAAVAALERHGNPPVKNTLGEVVGEVRAAFELPVAAGREV